MVVQAVPQEVEIAKCDQGLDRGRAAAAAALNADTDNVIIIMHPVCLFI